MSFYNENVDLNCCNCLVFGRFMWNAIEQMKNDYLDEKERFQEYISWGEEEQNCRNKNYIERVNSCKGRFMNIEDNLNTMYQLYFSYYENCDCRFFD